MPVFSTHSDLEITASSEASANAVEAFETNLLGLRKEIDEIVEAAEKDLQTPMLQACAAVYFLYGQSQQMAARAQPYLERAESGATSCTEREQLFIRAIRLLMGKRFYEALDLLEAQTMRYPRDLLAAKVSEFLYYCLGQHHSGNRFQTHMKRLEKANADSAGYWAMRSFSTELCGDYETAYPEAERSLNIDPFQPWAHHTLVHLLSRSGQADRKLETIEGLMPMWRQANRGIHCHNAWHLALLYLDQLDFEKVEAILQKELWGITPDTVFEQIDVIALLWRMDLAGVREETLWEEVAQQVEAHAGQCLLPFLEGHFAYALARTGREEATQQAIAKAQERAQGKSREAQEIWAPIGADFVAACADFGRGRTTEGVNRLEPCIERIPQVGGSDAQGDLFRQAYLSGLRDSGRQTDANRAFTHFYGTKWRTPFDDSLLNDSPG